MQLQPIAAEDAVLLGNGAELAMRIGAVVGPVTPDIVGGLAWRSYTLVNSERNTSDVLEQDHVFELPSGLGVDFRAGGFIVDARALYRPAFDDELTTAGGIEGDDEERDMHTFGAQASVGLAF